MFFQYMLSKLYYFGRDEKTERKLSELGGDVRALLLIAFSICGDWPANADGLK